MLLETALAVTLDHLSGVTQLLPVPHHSFLPPAKPDPAEPYWDKLAIVYGKTNSEGCWFESWAEKWEDLATKSLSPLYVRLSLVPLSHCDVTWLNCGYGPGQIVPCASGVWFHSGHLAGEATSAIYQHRQRSPPEGVGKTTERYES